MKRAIQALSAIGFIVAVGVCFQNCGTYQAGQTNFFDNSTFCAVNDPVCNSTAKSEAILMSVATPDPIQLLQADAYADISGFCDPNTFSYTELQYWIQGSSGNDLTQGYVRTGVPCDSMGRFEFTLPLSGTGSGSRSLTLKVRMPAFPDSTMSLAEAVDNPTGQNKSELTIYIQ